MKYSIIYVFIVLLCAACQNDTDAPVPDLTWELFEHSHAVYLSSDIITNLEGIYNITNGANEFGSLSVARVSYVINTNDTNWFVSVFCQASVKYFICEGKQLGDSVLLNGYWRNQTNTETGRARLIISKNNGADLILNNGIIEPDSVIIEGVYGFDNDIPEINIRFNYSRKLIDNISFDILAHRGGGRTSDLLPASENSVELIRMASKFGATGIEIDVRMTSDNVPILYHDENINDRLTQKSGLVGEIKNYTYAQLSAFVRLKNGEMIPTLRQALDAVLYQTPLKVIWLDIKYEGSLIQIRDLQQEYLQKSAVLGRDLEIYIGIPSETVKNYFIQIPDYKDLHSLVELSVDDARMIEADVWAPRWTEGLQNTLVSQMQLENRKVYTWTLDVSGYAQQYVNQGNFNGILSNYPSMIAFYHYAR